MASGSNKKDDNLFVKYNTDISIPITKNFK